MASKKNPWIDQDLTWLRIQAENMKAYVDNNPVSSLKDRIEWKQTRGGGTMPMVVATIEQQHKNIRETLKDYALILDSIAKLEEVESTKKSLIRGDQLLTPLEEGSLDS